MTCASGKNKTGIPPRSYIVQIFCLRVLRGRLLLPIQSGVYNGLHMNTFDNVKNSNFEE